MSKISIKDYKHGSWYMAHSIDEMQAFYMSRLRAIREAAKDCGYAIGLHGSTRRDFDLMAMPWRESVSTPDELAKAIMNAACGIVAEKFEWEKKPNGRIACSIPICWAQWEGCYEVKSLGHIDLSLIPALSQSPAPDMDKIVERLEGMKTKKYASCMSFEDDAHNEAIDAAIEAVKQAGRGVGDGGRLD